MKTYQYCLAATVLACGFTGAQAQMREDAPRSAVAVAPTRNFIEPTQETGTIIKKDLKWNSIIPLDKKFDQLTPEEMTALRAMYQSLPEDYEPPFPVEGLQPIFNNLKKAQHLLQARGKLLMAVTVGPDGKATKVEDYGGVRNPEMSEFAQSLLLLTKYKPAMCKGSPCAMQFPFVLQLKGS
jgi:Zn-dependent M32 family carboxypeptidase